MISITEAVAVLKYFKQHRIAGDPDWRPYIKAVGVIVDRGVSGTNAVELVESAERSMLLEKKRIESVEPLDMGNVPGLAWYMLVTNLPIDMAYAHPSPEGTVFYAYLEDISKHYNIPRDKVEAYFKAYEQDRIMSHVEVIQPGRMFKDSMDRWSVGPDIIGLQWGAIEEYTPEDKESKETFEEQKAILAHPDEFLDLGFAGTLNLNVQEVPDIDEDEDEEFEL